MDLSIKHYGLKGLDEIDYITAGTILQMFTEDDPHVIAAISTAKYPAHSLLWLAKRAKITKYYTMFPSVDNLTKFLKLELDRDELVLMACFLSRYLYHIEGKELKFTNDLLRKRFEQAFYEVSVQRIIDSKHYPEANDYLEQLIRKE